MDWKNLPRRIIVARMRARACLAAALLTLGCSGCGKKYVGRGLVLRLEEPALRITLSHEAIPGFMEAMAMPFSVQDRKELAGLKPGDRVSFRLVLRGEKSYLERFRVLSASATDSGMLLSPAAPTLVPVGEVFPDFELIDQNERAVSLAALRGRVVAVNFIYTRCPLPDYCPRMVNHFRSVSDRFAGRLGRELTLLTISFDPKHDRPETLRSYAGAFYAQREGWHFLTGSLEQINRVCAAFGVEYWPDEGLLTHSLQTAVIDREGRLAATIEGKDFSAGQLGDLLEMVLADPAPR
jgi:protein SCO1/2